MSPLPPIVSPSANETERRTDAPAAGCRAWDAENRLIGVEPLAEPMEGFRKLSFGYDHMGRRVRKTVYTYDGQDWVQTGDVKYVWAGWLLLLELDGTDSDAVLRKYTWGLDVAGQNAQLNSLESAGGIGGLGAVYDTNGTMTGQNPTEDDKTYAYLYEANGNVGQLVDWTDIAEWWSNPVTQWLSLSPPRKIRNVPRAGLKRPPGLLRFFACHVPRWTAKQATKNGRAQEASTAHGTRRAE